MIYRYPGSSSQYDTVWADPLRADVSQIDLRYAAAYGHRNLVALALQMMLALYKISAKLPNWPMASYALVGAAGSGMLEIVGLLLESGRIAMGEISEWILLMAVRAALRVGELIAAYGDYGMILYAIEQYTLRSPSCGETAMDNPNRE